MKVRILGDNTIAGRRALDIAVPSGKELRIGDTIETDLGLFKVAGFSSTCLPGADTAVVVRRVP